MLTEDIINLKQVESIEIELFEDKSEKLCIPENESMLLVGKCGTGKTKTIKDILRQVVDSGKVNVVYLDQHKNDYNDVKEICGNLLNKTNVLKEEELISLLKALNRQCELRKTIISHLNLNSIEELRGQQVETYYINGIEYMLDDIIQYNSSDGSQKFVIAKEYYESFAISSRLSMCCKSYNPYEPTKTIICIDEFFHNDMSDEINGMLYNTVLDLVRFGKTTLQNVICTSQSFSATPWYKKFCNIIDTKLMFHSAADNEMDYKILFDKENNKFYQHGDVTVQSAGKLTEFN